MNALTQYIDLYESNAETVNVNSAEVLNSHRPEALATLKRIGRLPDKGDEDFEKTSINDMFTPDFGVNINRMPLPADIASTFRCGVPNLSTLLGIVVNDRFVPTATLAGNTPEGVTICSLAKAAKENPELVKKYYGTIAHGNDAGAALNTLLAQDGVFIHIERGVRLDKAIQLVNIFHSSFPLMAARRVLLVAEEGAKVAVLNCDHTRPGSDKCLSSTVVEIVASRDAEVDWYEIEESNDATSRYCQVYARQDDGSTLNVCGSTLTNGSTRNEYHLDITGQHTHTSLSGMVIASDKQHVDNCSDVRHNACHGHSNQMFKYVLDDNATAAFEGSIEVCHGAQFVEAYQSNRNILASTGARMHSKPRLLIYNDDVKCSHGATTGQLDEKALFYMQARGINRTDARRMLMQAFMVDIIDAITLEPLRDRLRHMVERRFAGERAGCRDCTIMCDKPQPEQA